MAKKNFITGFDALLQSTTEEAEQQIEAAPIEQPQQPQPTESEEKGTIPAAITPSTTRGRGRPKTNHTGVRATFIVEADTLEKVRALAYWERAQIKDILDEALNDYLREYEKNNGTIKPLR